ncbi:hypothetical protein AFK68_26465 [Hydrocoleum sp. CS-953]|nr:hypothetical protein AFK68_26465 [Hydrocoleum sp. CS-953]
MRESSGVRSQEGREEKESIKRRKFFWSRTSERSSITLLSGHDIKQYPDHAQTLPLLKDRAANDSDPKLRKWAKETLQRLKNS